MGKTLGKSLKLSRDKLFSNFFIDIWPNSPSWFIFVLFEFRARVEWRLCDICTEDFFLEDRRDIAVFRRAWKTGLPPSVSYCLEVSSHQDK